MARNYQKAQYNNQYNPQASSQGFALSRLWTALSKSQPLNSAT